MLKSIKISFLEMIQQLAKSSQYGYSLSGFYSPKIPECLKKEKSDT